MDKIQSKINHKERFNYEAVLEKMLLGNEFHYLILDALRNYSDEKLWLGGGVVRNFVWDSLHNVKTVNKDVDIFYFNKSETSKYFEKIVPSINWSVKNQARMHLVNDEPPYKNLREAIEKFPETASSVVCRLTDKNHILIIAPHSLRDLFTLIVQPTPHFSSSILKIERYNYRIKKKKWITKWPNLLLKDLRAYDESNYSRYKPIKNFIGSGWRGSKKFNAGGKFANGYFR
jgi:hypothetical protein